MYIHTLPSSSHHSFTHFEHIDPIRFCQLITGFSRIRVSDRGKQRMDQYNEQILHETRHIHTSTHPHNVQMGAGSAQQHRATATAVILSHLALLCDGSYTGVTPHQLTGKSTKRPASHHQIRHTRHVCKSTPDMD